MGAVLCCFQVRDHEEQQAYGPDNGGFYKQHFLGRNLFHKYARIFNEHEVQALPQDSNPEENGAVPYKMRSDPAYGLIEDECPICLEEYTYENPKMALPCCHEYHFACILNWNERSSACPFCEQTMPFGEES